MITQFNKDSPSCMFGSFCLSRTSCSISLRKSSSFILHESKASLTNSDTSGLVEISSSSFHYRIRAHNDTHFRTTLLRMISFHFSWVFFFFLTSLDFGLVWQEAEGVFPLTASAKIILTLYLKEKISNINIITLLTLLFRKVWHKAKGQITCTKRSACLHHTMSGCTSVFCYIQLIWFREGQTIFFKNSLSSYWQESLRLTMAL